MKTPSDRLSGNKRPPFPPFHLPRRSLVVLERDCPAPAEEPSRFVETVTIAQARNEQPSDFAHRALRQIALHDRSGRRFDEAILFVGNADDPGTEAARRLIALGIAAVAEATGTLPELLVMAPADADMKLREQLLALTNDLV